MLRSEIMWMNTRMNINDSNDYIGEDETNGIDTILLSCL